MSRTKVVQGCNSFLFYTIYLHKFREFEECIYNILVSLGKKFRPWERVLCCKPHQSWILGTNCISFWNSQLSSHLTWLLAELRFPKLQAKAPIFFAFYNLMALQSSHRPPLLIYLFFATLCLRSSFTRYISQFWKAFHGLLFHTSRLNQSPKLNHWNNKPITIDCLTTGKSHLLNLFYWWGVILGGVDAVGLWLTGDCVRCFWWQHINNRDRIESLNRHINSGKLSFPMHK